MAHLAISEPVITSYSIHYTKLYDAYRDDREVQTVGDILHRFVAGHAKHGLVLGIDGEQASLERRLEHVADQHVA